MGSHSQDASGDAKMRALIAEGQILLAQGQTEAATESFLSENNTVTTEARLADGGNIQVTAQTLLRLRDSEITATVGGGVETVGGNITIDPKFVILEESQILAEAFQGQGGNIGITAEANTRLVHSVLHENFVVVSSLLHIPPLDSCHRLSVPARFTG